jgi:2-methylcitrate dehydratase PrpD
LNSAAAGRLMGLSPEQMANAMGLCGSLSAGSMQFLVDGAWNKPFHTGYAAMNGLTAASVAAHGFKGAVASIEGKSGFLNAYAPKPEPELAVADLGRVWETRQIAVKPYPSCRYGHAAMDALIALRHEHEIDPDDIEAVEIGLPQTGWRLIGEPEAEKQEPKNYVDGQFSMAFVGAVALREGGMNWDDYAKHLDDPKTRSLCRKTRAVVDTAVEAEFPAHMSGVARVKTANDAYEKMVVVAKGEPENFLETHELRAKFDALAAPYIGADACDGIAAQILDLEHADVRELMALARPAISEGIPAGQAAASP